ncbi:MULTISPECIES: hypothetical protein [unclassified Arenibacter]|uniref:beta strand repeat-containing protein n=1 Tax=unclassified Arenibacter TaxID=2615047 RepID=UPI000E34467B|nr:MULTISPECIES: hypothetical protein [unclassified Arenibacter]MCM4164184.1 hypothetical protein [Arenibacter sp. A80]RFT55982.1 hypothetical protein D0S24_11310 [Arenibacter sp. P308M17]
MKYIHFFFCLLLGMAVQAQIKIGDNPQNIDPSSVLELESSSRVLVITRVNTAQMNAITPSSGALVYNTDIECIHYYTGTEWKDICDAVAGSITFTSDDATVVITSTGGNNFDLKVGQITGMNIVNETIFGADIATATIGERQLAPNSVSASELQDNTVGKDEIQEAAVGTLEIIDGTIQPSDMQPGAFDQLLTTDAAGNVVWVNKNELGATQADQTTITGAGTAADPIKVADTVIGDILANANAITVNSNNIAQNSNDIGANTTSINDHITADGDLDDQNEILTGAEIQGNELVITESGNETRVDLGAFNNTGSDNQNLGPANLTGQNLTINIQNGNPTTANLSAFATDTEMANAITTSENADNDKAEDNELITNAVLTGTDLVITEAGNPWTVPLASLSGSNGADGSIIDPNGGTFINITGAGTAASPYVINNTFTEVDGSLSNELTDIAFNTTTNILSLTNPATVLGGSVNLSSLAGGTDDQTAAEVTYDNTTSLLSATDTQAAIDELAASGGTDDQTAAEVTYDNTTSLLTATDTQAAIDELAANGGTDDQNIESLGLVGTTLTVGIEDGTAQTVNLAALLGTDDQTAAEVTYDNTTSLLTATDTQAAIDELAASPATDDQNIESLGLVGTTLTVGIEDGTAQTVNLAALLGTDDQTAAEVTYDNTTSLLTATDTQAAIDELAAASGEENLSNTDLTQTTGQVRTYDLNGSDLIFRDNSGLPTTGNVGIGNLPGAPQSQLDVNGQIQASDGFAATEGTAGQPSYGFYTDGDTNTGMFRADEDQIGFSTNGQEAIRIDASQNVGVGTIAPNSTLHTGGSFSTAILITNSDLTLDNSHHTIILGDNHNITLPSATLFTGRIYIIKNNTAFTPTISTYLDSDGAPTNAIALGVIQLQSDGSVWQQIN